jgi:hypothetical protein
MRSVAQFVLPLVMVLPTVDGAAQAVHASAPTDTLRYRQSTVRRFTRDAEYGLTLFHFTHNALIALAIGRQDSASAWYEQLTLGLVSSAGAVRHDTQGHLFRPFTLAIDSIGNVQTLAVPTFPPVDPPVDLTQQFRDFFPSLPAAALTVGLEWSDTIQFADSSEDRRVRSRRLASYRVTHDSTVGSARAVVVVAIQTVSQESYLRGARGNDLGMTISGTDTNTFVLDAQHRWLIARDKVGRYHATITIPSTSYSPAPEFELHEVTTVRREDP